MPPSKHYRTAPQDVLGYFRVLNSPYLRIGTYITYYIYALIRQSICIGRHKRSHQPIDNDIRKRFESVNC
jgi:hypothetical protein